MKLIVGKLKLSKQLGKKNVKKKKNENNLNWLTNRLRS